MRKGKLICALTSCVLLLTSCGSGETAAIVGERNITKNEIEFYMASYKEGMGTAEGAKEYSVKYAKSGKLTLEAAKKMGIVFDEEEREEADQYKSDFIKSKGGESKYENFLKEYDITDEFIDDLIDARFMKDKLIEEAGDIKPSDDDMKDYFNKNYRRAKHVLLLTHDDTTGGALSDEEKQKKKEQADELLKRAKDGEDFNAMILEYSQDPGSESNPNGYIFTDGEMVEQFQNTVDALGMYEFGLCESDFGYHIIERLPLDETEEIYNEAFNDVKDNIANIIIEQRYENRLSEWADEYGINISENQEVIDSIIEE